MSEIVQIVSENTKVSGETLMQICNELQIPVFDIEGFDLDYVSWAFLELNGVRAKLDFRFMRSWEVTFLHEDWNGFSSSHLRNVLEAYKLAVNQILIGK